MLIDSHCHLDTFGDELDAVLARAADAGVGEVVTISTRLSQAPELIAMTRRPGVWWTVGGAPPHPRAGRPRRRRVPGQAAHLHDAAHEGEPVAVHAAAGQAQHGVAGHDARRQ